MVPLWGAGHICSATPQEPGQLAAVVTFFVGLDQFDVRIVQGGPNSSGGEGDQTLVFRNGVPFNAAGIEGAVDFNVTSPNFPEPHNLVELEVPLLQTDETPGGLPPDQGGIYDPAPSFWGAQVAGSDLIQVSSNIIDIGNGSTTNTTVIPIIEAMEVQVEEAEVQLGRRTRRHRFEAEGTFELGPDGMVDVAGEGVQVGLFGLFDQTLPAGSFVSDDDEFEFEGRSRGIVEMQIDDHGEFEIEIRRVDLSALNLDEPVILQLRIGNDVGQFSIQFDDDGEFEADDDDDDDDGNN